MSLVSLERLPHEIEVYELMEEGINHANGKDVKKTKSKAIKLGKKLRKIEWKNPSKIRDSIIHVALETTLSLFKFKTNLVIKTSELLESRVCKISAEEKMPSPYTTAATTYGKYLALKHRQDQLLWESNKNLVIAPARFMRYIRNFCEVSADKVGLTKEAVGQFYELIAQKTYQIVTQTTPQIFRKYLSECFTEVATHPDLDFPNVDFLPRTVKFKQGVTERVDASRIKTYLTKKNPEEKALKNHLDTVIGEKDSAEMLTHLKELKTLLQESKTLEDLTQEGEHRDRRVEAWNRAFPYLLAAAQTLNMPELAQMVTFAKTSFDIFSACSAIGSMGAGCSAMAVTPHVALIVAAGVTLFNLLQDDVDNSSSVFPLLFEQMQMISRRIENVRKEMHQRFERLELGLKRQFDHMADSLLGLAMQSSTQHRELVYSLSHIEHDLVALSKELKYMHEQQLLSSLSSAISAIKNFKKRDGANADMLPEQYKELCIVLEGWLLDPLNSKGFNGSLYLNSTKPRKINALLTPVPDLGSLLGYLAGYAESVLALPFPEGISTGKLPNARLWNHTLKIYLKLRLTHSSPTHDARGLMLEDIIAHGKNTIETIDYLSDSRELFHKLVDDYLNSLTAIQIRIAKFMQKENAKLVADLKKVRSELITEEEMNVRSAGGDFEAFYKAYKTCLTEFDGYAENCEQVLLGNDAKTYTGISQKLPSSTHYPLVRPSKTQNYDFFPIPLPLTDPGFFKVLPLDYRVADCLGLGKFEFKYTIRKLDGNLTFYHISTPKGWSRRTFLTDRSLPEYPPQHSMPKLGIDVGVYFAPLQQSSRLIGTFSHEAFSTCEIERNSRYIGMTLGMQISALQIFSVWHNPTAVTTTFQPCANAGDQDPDLQVAVKAKITAENKQRAQALIAKTSFKELLEKFESAARLLHTYGELAALPQEMLSKIDGVWNQSKIDDFYANADSETPFLNFPSVEVIKLKDEIDYFLENKKNVLDLYGKDHSIADTFRYSLSLAHGCLANILEKENKKINLDLNFNAAQCNEVDDFFTPRNKENPSGLENRVKALEKKLDEVCVQNATLIEQNQALIGQVKLLNDLFGQFMQKN